MYRLSFKNRGLVVDNIPKTCGQCEKSYTQKSVVVFVLFIFTPLLRVLLPALYSSFYTRLSVNFNLLGGAVLHIFNNTNNNNYI
jgi:hypothetical protein